MEAGVVEAVENILSYRFQNKKLLEEALTHSSFTEAVSYERLEFIGDPILSLMISNHLFLSYPTLDPGHLSLLRAANVSTEKLARVAIRNGLHRFVRHNSNPLPLQVQRFVHAVTQESHPVAYGGLVKAPKVLADIVESLTAAIYIDLNFDLKQLWAIIRRILVPIVTPDDLEQQPQPVTKLFQTCQKKGKRVDIQHETNRDKTIANVFVDGEFIASASSDQKMIARLEAAKIALHKLPDLVVPTNTKKLNIDFGIDSDGTLVVEAAKHRLHELTEIKRWPKPEYRIEKDLGPTHKKRFVSAVRIAIANDILHMSGYEKSRVKDAENSAASLMIWALKEGNYL